MGQQHSHNGTVICCTIREADEAKCEKSPNKPRLVISEDTARDDFNDGGTGGTTGFQSPRCRKDKDCISGSFLDLDGIACIQDRNDNAIGRRVLLEGNAMKPKLEQLRSMEAEVESLVLIRGRICKRLPADKGKSIKIPESLEAGGVKCILEAELVRRLRLHEESLMNVPEKFVAQACKRALPAKAGKLEGIVGRSVGVEDMKAHYADILNAVDTLLQERISKLHKELDKVDEQVGDLEDEVYKMFMKMDEDINDTISMASFVDFICVQDVPEVTDATVVLPLVNPEDAESLFLQMSNGEKEMTFEQFKDEMTAGCLHVLQANLNWRRHTQKRYRDTWF